MNGAVEKWITVNTPVSTVQPVNSVLSPADGSADLPPMAVWVRVTLPVMPLTGTEPPSKAASTLGPGSRRSRRGQRVLPGALISGVNRVLWTDAPARTGLLCSSPCLSRHGHSF
jgi:hypothetical protein